MKIIFVITKYGVGGAQKYITDLAQSLDSQKYEFRIVAGRSDISSPTHYPLPISIITSPSLSNDFKPHLLFWNDLAALCELIKIFYKEKPDVIHLNSSKAGVIGAIAGKIYSLLSSSHSKIIFTAHGWVFQPTNDLSLLRRRFYRLLHKFAALFQNKIICVSDYDRRIAIDYKISRPEKLITIHNGLADKSIDFLTRENARAALKEKINSPVAWNNARPWIGSIGRLTFEKNYETLCAAMSLIPDAYCVIIGAGAEETKIRQTIRNLKLEGRFFVVKIEDGAAKYLKAFDVFAMTSIKEGLPYVLLEAFAALVPVVVTRAGGIGEVVKNRENGLLLPQRSPEKFALAVNLLLNDKNLASTLAKNADTVLSEEFSLKKMAKETARVYEN